MAWFYKGLRSKFQFSAGLYENYAKGSRYGQKTVWFVGDGGNFYALYSVLNDLDDSVPV